MRKMISVQEPIGDGTKDRGEKNFGLILDDTGIEKTKGMVHELVEKYPMPDIARVDCYRGGELKSNTASGAAAGLLLGGVKGAIVGGLLTSGSSKSWWIEIELSDQAVHYYRLIKESDHDVFLKWAEKYGVKVGASNNMDTAGTSGSSASAADEILKYKQLWDMGVLTEEEFEVKKKQLLDL